MKIFAAVISCPLRCEGIRNEPQRGVIPRSFYFSDGLGVDLLLVSKNPADAPAWEREKYAALPEVERVAAHLEVVRSLFTGALAVRSSFHMNLLRRVGAILDCEPTLDAVFARTALTALVKCESSGDKTARLPLTTATTCAERHLAHELAYFRPAYILALGREAFTYLTQPRVQAIVRLPVGELYHPSWSNMRGGESQYFQTAIPRLRREFQAALQARAQKGSPRG
ncbi:MAG TPA: uracil-DNA glycosylase family protein [Terriglobia bacterium]|nr:uracil-DNA glycosylase family protein [Terriglobia bacterium]